METAKETENTCNRNQKQHVFLPLSDKLNIIEAINAGQSVSSLARQYKISRAAISNLKKTQKLVKDARNLNEAALNRRKVIKRVNNTELENAIVTWFNEKRSMGQPVTGPIICEKALLFNKLLNGSKNFKATTGWLSAFKKRYGIKLSVLPGDQLPTDLDVAKEFCSKFQQMINREEYDLCLVFNADETGFFYKSLPKPASNSSENSENSSGWKDNKERVTALFCANAEGSHALPLLIIGKSWSSRSNLSTSEKILQLPVMYQNHSSACMTTEIFMDWYTNIFIPSVQEMQQRIGKFGNVLLLLDVAKCHPSKEILDAVNENFQVMFIPSNVSPLVQPMGQGVIDRTKRMYRKSFLTSILETDDETTIETFMESHTMEECCFMLANAFQSVTMMNLKNAWNKLYGVSQLEDVNDDYDDLMLEIREYCRLVHEIKGLENIYQATIKMWLNADKYDPGWESLSDEEIIQLATRKPIETIELPTKVSVETTELPTKEPIETTELPTTEPIETTELLTTEPIETTELLTTEPIETTELSTMEPIETTELSTSLPIEIHDIKIEFSDENLEKKVEYAENDTKPQAKETSQSVELNNDRNLQSKKNPSIQSVEVAIQNLRNWCKKRKEFTQADYRILQKWETLARKASEEDN